MNNTVSLEKKVIVFFAGMILLLTLVLAASAYMVIGNTKTKEAAVEMNTRTQLEAERLNQEYVRFESIVNHMLSLADKMVQSPEQMKDPAQRALFSQRMQEMFDSVTVSSKRTLGYFNTFDPDLVQARDGIYYTRENGKMVSHEITDIKAYAPDDIEHVGWFTLPKHYGMAMWMQPYFNKNTGHYMITYVAPFYKNGVLISVIGMDFDFDALLKEVGSIHYLSSGHYYLKSAEGDIHYHPRDFGNGPVHGDAEEYPDIGAVKFARRATDENEMITYRYDGEDRLQTFTTLRCGLKLVLSGEKDEIYAARDHMLLVIVAVMVISCLVTLGFAVLFTRRRLIRPLKQLTDAVMEIKNKHYDVELPEEAPGEIGLLTQGIRMAAKAMKEQEAFNISTITEQNRKLEIAMKEAQKADEAKTAFLFNMSHDIRTPMNAIIGFANLLDKNLDNKELAHNYIAKIQSSNNFLLSLVNNVLEMARIESGKATVDESYGSIRDIADSTAAVFEMQMREKNISFVHTVAVEHDAVMLDITKTREILLNLLSNAVKYTPGGGSVSMNVRELPSERQGYAVYQTTIADTGIGMPAEFLPHLFEAFSREKTATKSGILGTGLGMLIVKRLVELMGGTIEVSSEYGKGTIFVITVPYRITSAPVAKKQSEDALTEDYSVFNGMRLLLAEDNDLNAEIATMVLEDKGFKVERAADGNICVEMLQKAEAGYYDFILMDVQMPQMSGYEATRIIRGLEEPEKAEIPVIAMTANAFDEDKRNALMAGMNAHVAKPFEPEALFKTIANVLRHKGEHLRSDAFAAFKKQYEALGGACGFFIYRADSEEAILYADRRTAEIFGCENQEEFLQFVNGSFKTMVHANELEAIHLAIDAQQEASHEGLDYVVYDIIRKDGKARRIEDIGCKVYNGEELVYYVYIVDVTELKT